MGHLSELKGVEKPVTEWLSKMGWTFKSNEDLKIYERAFFKPIIEQILVENTAKINDITEDVAKHAVELLFVLVKQFHRIITDTERYRRISVFPRYSSSQMN